MKPPRFASAVVLHRDGPGGRPQVFWIKRGPRVPFMAGFHAFPGGAADKADATLEVANGPAGEPAAALACAIRELFEETGVMLAAGKPSRETLESWRTKLLTRPPASFAELLRGSGTRLDASALVPSGHWITPPFSPIRFDTRFYLVRLPEGAEARVIPGELESGEWIEPASALERWEAGEALAAPPVIHLLRSAASSSDPARWPAIATGIAEASGGEVRRIEMRKGIVLVPLRAPTLPPATHTNCYVVGGSRPIVVDPGSAEPEEMRALDEILDALSREGRKASRIVITHHHLDHAGGVEPLARRLGIPVAATAQTKEQLAPAGVRVTETVAEGHRFDTGGPPVVALETPGHARGHLALLETATQSLLSGDLILGMGTTVIDPPDGDMEDYMRSLERLAGMPLRALFPGHGPVLASALDKITEYRAHRAEREEQILAALDEGRGTPEAIVEKVYADVPVELHPFAARSVIAHLEWLERRGLLSKSAGPRWARR